MSRDSQSHHVLIVDDEPAAAQRAADIAVELGYTVEIFDSAASCLGFMSDHVPDADPAALLLDILMPEKDAIEFIQELNGIGAEIPIILTTSAGPRLIRVVKSLAGVWNQRVVASVEKPLTVDSLKKAFDALESDG